MQCKKYKGEQADFCTSRTSLYFDIGLNFFSILPYMNVSFMVSITIS